LADIFISYSRKDSEQANLLAELLSSAGLSCWIDREGIDVATSWSGEIVDAIEQCKAFVVLISPSSVESHNVIKEVSLAAEQRKKILPLDLEPVELPRDMKYHLAGIQRAPMTNIDAVIRALGKLGLEATGAPRAPKIVKENDERKSLMILPFEDFSPTGDNGWFADGLASELINSLSPLKALRVSDHQATKDYKRYQGTLPVYAKEMAVRYFLQGQVRKFGDQIKISITLLDIESGDHLWQDAMKGTMQDIFDIQEKVAEKVVEGLKIHLASDEKKKLAERGTESAEAYELVLKSREYFQRQTKEGLQLTAQLLSEAIVLDPTYAIAYSGKASALAAQFANYTRDPRLLEEGLRLITKALQLKPDLWVAYGSLSVILRLQGMHSEAEAAVQEYIRNAPEDAGSHFVLGFFYANTGQDAKAITSYEETVKRRPEFLSALANLVAACNKANEEKKQKQWAGIAIPLFEKHLKLFPDEEMNRVTHALLLHFAGRDEDARSAARKLDGLRDGSALFNIACLQFGLKEYSAGLQVFRKALQAGFRNTELSKSFLDDGDGIGTLKGTQEWEAVREMVEKIEVEEKANA
jgi:TolB-like protein